MSLYTIKLMTVGLMIAAAVGVSAFKSPNVGATVITSDDAATTYKAKCAMCHKPDASKFFDPALSDDDLVQAILKGKKAEKPPNRPSFGEKNITEDQAKELVAYMKGLKSSAGN